jgi:hypothetical protein
MPSTPPDVAAGTTAEAAGMAEDTAPKNRTEDDPAKRKAAEDAKDKRKQFRRQLTATLAGAFIALGGVIFTQLYLSHQQHQQERARCYYRLAGTVSSFAVAQINAVNAAIDADMLKEWISLGYNSDTNTASLREADRLDRESAERVAGAQRELLELMAEVGAAFGADDTRQRLMRDIVLNEGVTFDPALIQKDVKTEKEWEAQRDSLKARYRRMVMLIYVPNLILLADSVAAQLGMPRLQVDRVPSDDLANRLKKLPMEVLTDDGKVMEMVPGLKKLKQISDR